MYIRKFNVFVFAIYPNRKQKHHTCRITWSMKSNQKDACVITDEGNTAKRLHVKSLVLLFNICPAVIKLCAYFLLNLFAIY